jgi:2-oxoglutarate ferredoxin oxidoreductase subunit delta
MATGRIEIDEALCKGCILCTHVCPKDLVIIDEDRLTAKGYHPAMLSDPNLDCTGCAICAVICPEAAIAVYRYVSAAKAVSMTT